MNLTINHFSSTIFLLLVTLLLATAQGQESWSGFRGPGSLGYAENENLPDKWTTTENVAWKRDIAGRGWSSPVVWHDSVFLTTVINTGETEAPKKGLYFGGDRSKPPTSVHQWKVICLDLNSGEVRWEKQVHEGVPATSMHIKSSYASETAVTDGRRVVICFGNLGLFCFDMNGNELWRRDITPRKTRAGWGTAASPVLHDEKVYYCYDNEEASFLQAIDAKTGTELWRKDRDEKSNWSTPLVWKNSKRTEIVTPGTGLVRSYDLDGNVLWSLKGMSSITIATPYVSGDLLYLSSGYVMDPKRPIYAIKPGASGDISLKDGESSNAFITWSQSKAAPYNPSTLVYRDRMYVLYDRGTVACYDAKDGHEVYGMQRLTGSSAFTASPWAYNGKVFCLSEDGVTTVFKAGDEFELLHTNALAEDDMGMASPAIIGDLLLIRTAARIYCFRK